jgi:hypothetical protein
VYRTLDGGGLANWGVWMEEEVECRGALKRLEEGLVLVSGLFWKRKDGGVCLCVRLIYFSTLGSDWICGAAAGDLTENWEGGAGMVSAKCEWRLPSQGLRDPLHSLGIWDLVDALGGVVDELNFSKC